ncbi:MAG TPA: hypothetical protein VFX59_23615 [Polyangiales bacterium]|nr:hypothetical protein [Polyangiales bacterium]
MPTLSRGNHMVVVHNVASGYATIVRTERTFASYDEAERALAECDRALLPLDRALGILLDWRRAPMSTDPRLHTILVERSDVFLLRFARRALLTQTSVGSMQSVRLLRGQPDSSPVVFADEEAAVAYVCGRRPDLELERA